MNSFQYFYFFSVIFDSIYHWILYQEILFKYQMQTFRSVKSKKIEILDKFATVLE